MNKTFNKTLLPALLLLGGLYACSPEADPTSPNFSAGPGTSLLTAPTLPAQDSIGIGMPPFTETLEGDSTQVCSEEEMLETGCPWLGNNSQ